MRKQLIACLGSNVDVSNVNSSEAAEILQGAMPDNAATEMVLGTDYRLAADSCFYGINEKESTSFGTVGQIFVYQPRYKGT